MKRLLHWSWVLGLLGAILFIAFATWLYLYREVGPTGTALGISSTVLLLAWATLDRQRVGDTVSSRAFVYSSGSNLVVLLAGLVAISIYALAQRYDHTWDLTVAQDLSLSVQTTNILDEIDQSVNMYAFFREGSQDWRAFERLAGHIDEHTDKVDVRMIDPTHEPDMAREFDITTDSGLVVLVVGERSERIAGRVDETTLMDALVNLLSSQLHRICWSVGHGELDHLDMKSPFGAGGAVALLEGRNFTVEDIHPLTGRIDSDCEVLVIARPEVDWLSHEREALARYVAEGGQVLMMLDAWLTAELSVEMERYGVRMGMDQVVDLSVENTLVGIENPSWIVLTRTSFQPHPITHGLRASVVLAVARSVAPMVDVMGLRSDVLLQTGANAWAETNPDPLADRLQPDDGELVGQVPLMVAVEIDDPHALEVDIVSQTGEDSLLRDEMATRVYLVLDAFYPDRDPQLRRSPDTRLREDLGADDTLFQETMYALSYEVGMPIETERLTDIETISDTIDLAMDLTRHRTAVATENTEALGAQAPRTGPFHPTAGGRLVVLGDADFLTNQLVGLGNNKDLFLDSIAWLSNETHQLGERSDEGRGDELEPTFIELSLVCLGATVFVPGMAIFVAVLTILRRRRL